MKMIVYGAFFAGLVTICVIAVKSYCRKLSGGCCGGGGEKRVRANRVTDCNPAHYPYLETLVVDGMVCANCANTVANALNALDGVWASVDLSGRTAVVRMKKHISPGVLRETVGAAGPYTVLRITEEVR